MTGSDIIRAEYDTQEALFTPGGTTLASVLEKNMSHFGNF